MQAISLVDSTDDRETRSILDQFQKPTQSFIWSLDFYIRYILYLRVEYIDSIPNFLESRRNHWQVMKTIIKEAVFKLRELIREMFICLKI